MNNQRNNSFIKSGAMIVFSEADIQNGASSLNFKVKAKSFGLFVFLLLPIIYFTYFFILYYLPPFVLSALVFLFYSFAEREKVKKKQY